LYQVSNSRQEEEEEEDGGLWDGLKQAVRDPFT
jgi:hypothetical protein